MRKIFIFLVVIMLISSFQCKIEAGSRPDREAVAVIYINMETAENENLKEHLDTIHPESPAYSATEKLMPQIFSIYDLDYSIKNIKVVASSPDEIKVSFIQTTKKVRGPEFKDNVVKGSHLLRKSEGKWKIYNSIIDSIDYLN